MTPIPLPAERTSIIRERFASSKEGTLNEADLDLIVRIGCDIEFFLTYLLLIKDSNPSHCYSIGTFLKTEWPKKGFKDGEASKLWWDRVTKTIAKKWPAT
jgi:hypothetical protein